MKILKPRIKICGITNQKDAFDAIEAGADALGFVFYQNSSRYIEPVEAKKIIANLPPFIQNVGLFVNETPQNIDYIATIAKIDTAQIHFEVDEQFFDRLDTKYIKVVRAKSKEDILKYQDQYRIIDAFVPQYGGEGKRINLEWFDNIDCSKIILAGGLTPDNLNQLKKYNFYALDVSSGVEYKKGIKDKQKMFDFVNKANELYR